MKLLFISADEAVDEIGVARELMRITDLILYENSMDGEPLFGLFASLAPRGMTSMKEIVLEEYARTGCYGFIFTYTKTERTVAELNYFEHIARIFTKEKPDTEIYYVSLTASQVQDKPNDYRSSGYGIELFPENRMSINLADQPCDKAALMIKERFGL